MTVSFAAGSAGCTIQRCGKNDGDLRAILRALHRRGRKLSAFKCGPDYIDPMFHREVLGYHPTIWTFFVGTKNGPPANDGRRTGGGFGPDGRGHGILRWNWSYGTGRKLRFACATRSPAVLVLDGRGQHNRCWPRSGISYISLRQPDSRSSLESFISQPVSALHERVDRNLEFDPLGICRN